MEHKPKKEGKKGNRGTLSIRACQIEKFKPFCKPKIQIKIKEIKKNKKTISW
jgi:hypothetical protein